MLYYCIYKYLRYFCVYFFRHLMKNCRTDSRKKLYTRALSRDEIIQVNGVAYIEGNLKITHLRILMTIISHLQSALQFKISRRRKNPYIPDKLLPGQFAEKTRTRILTIPVAEFNLGQKNGGRLRSYFEELQETRLVFPESVKCLDGLKIVNTFQGLIAGYSFPPYSKEVDIYLLEEMVRRLLLTEEGFSTYSHKSAMSLTNKYTVRIYWLISSWRNKGGFVISLDTFKRILSLGPAYDRYDNIVSKIISPAQQELKDRFPIWFQYRLYRLNGVQRLVFKIKMIVSPEQRRHEMESARDICFNLLMSIGVKIDIIQQIFSQTDYEDIKPFLSKLMDLTSYIRNNTHISDVNSYVSASMDLWFSDWLARYSIIDDENDLSDHSDI